LIGGGLSYVVSENDCESLAALGLPEIVEELRDFGLLEEY